MPIDGLLHEKLPPEVQGEVEARVPLKAILQDGTRIIAQALGAANKSLAIIGNNPESQVITVRHMTRWSGLEDIPDVYMFAVTVFANSHAYYRAPGGGLTFEVLEPSFLGDIYRQCEYLAGFVQFRPVHPMRDL